MSLSHYCRSRLSKAALVIVATLLLVSSLSSNADQNDPKLDELFTRLREATNPRVAKRAEHEIWAIWHETPDDTSLEIMRNARTALDSADFDLAISLLDKLVEYTPDFAEAWNQRAIVLYFTEDYSGSLRDIEQTLKLEPRHFGAMSGRGQVYLRLDELELALQAFESALDRNPWMDNIRGKMQMIRARINSRQKPI